MQKEVREAGGSVAEAVDGKVVYCCKNAYGNAATEPSEAASPDLAYSADLIGAGGIITVFLRCGWRPDRP
jgi:hypothetical protein